MELTKPSGLVSQSVRPSVRPPLVSTPTTQVSTPTLGVDTITL